MEGEQDFDYINSTYFHMFGLSQMYVFFEKRPDGGSNLLKWRLRKALSYFFAFFYFPVWFSLETSGILFGRKSELEEVAFAIAYISYMMQMVIKLNYVLFKIEDFQKLCLHFQDFHTSRHRPGFSKAFLEEYSNFLRRMAKIYYLVIYSNLVLWNVSPLLVQPVKVILHLTGYVRDDTATLIPDIFPVVYVFDEREAWYLRTITGFLEWIVVNGGLVYAVALELFFMSVFLMLAAEMDVICKSALSAKELSQAIDRDYSSLLGSKDDTDRIHLNLLIKDHQFVLEKIKKLSEIMNPLLGVAICYCMVLLPTLGVVTTTAMKSAGSIPAAVRDSISWIAATLTELLTLFLYSWFCAKLKDSEEAIFEAVYSTNWYERDKRYRDTVLVIMGKSIQPRNMRMLYCGVMDRETFVAGLKGIYSFYNFVIGFE